MQGELTLNFDPDEVAEFMAALHITGISKMQSMDEILEQDNCRGEAQAIREGRATLTIMKEGS